MFKFFIITIIISNFCFSYPMTKINQSLSFIDDLDFDNIELAIERQLRSFLSQDLTKKINLATDTYTQKDMQETLIFFQKLTQRTKECLHNHSREVCYANFNLVLNQNFLVYKPIPLNWERGYEENKTLFTAYYSPDLHGKLKRDEVYKNPIYTQPSEEHLRKLSREEIDFDHKLEGLGYELVYVKESLFDIWLMHVEGGGRVEILHEDSSVEKRYLSYQAANGHRFQFLRQYMIESGFLAQDKASVREQRKFLEQNPDKQREIFASSPSYIFFQFTKDEPLGVRNIPLTENRSMATDYRIYKDYGFLNFVQAQRPYLENDEVKMMDFGRFFITQDTGGAIKGHARADLYFGYGEDASLTANSLKVLGDQYFLMLNPNRNN